jgi:hypothetical protein
MTMIVSIDQFRNQVPEQVRNAVTRIFEERGQMTVRALFYHLVSRGVIQKTETEYDKLCACF